MTNVERFLAALNGEKVDRLPVVEWAGWWNQTLERWYGEGLSKDIPRGLIQNHFGLDPMHRFWFHSVSQGAPSPAYNGRFKSIIIKSLLSLSLVSLLPLLLIVQISCFSIIQ